MESPALARCVIVWAGVSALLGCERRDPPGVGVGTETTLTLSSGHAPSSTSEAAASSTVELGSLDDNLPFRPSGEKVASIAWRTWIYTDTGPARTRLGYLRAGAILDARGPLLKNEGCAGGWLRINPRGFVCLGKGATQDLKHPVVVQSTVRAVRGEGFPYQYAKSRERAPNR